MLSIPPSVFAGDSSLQPLGLATPELAVQVMPALGAKVLSLVDRTLGTEWMWTPPYGRGALSQCHHQSFCPEHAGRRGRVFSDGGGLRVQGAPDPLDIAAAWNGCQRLAFGASISWSMSLLFENL